MKFTTIDLLSGSHILKQSEKLETELECKFVILSNETEHFLIFGPLHQYNYHAKLIERFCLERNLNSDWRKQPDLYYINDTSIKINGGGWFRFDFFQKTLIALGISTAYGRFDEQIFDQFANQNLIYKDFAVCVR